MKVHKENIHRKKSEIVGDTGMRDIHLCISIKQFRFLKSNKLKQKALSPNKFDIQTIDYT